MTNGRRWRIFLPEVRKEKESPDVKDETSKISRESLLSLFWRFFRFGLLVWGGPIPQIAMIRQELLEEGQWISKGRFRLFFTGLRQRIQAG